MKIFQLSVYLEPFDDQRLTALVGWKTIRLPFGGPGAIFRGKLAGKTSQGVFNIESFGQNLKTHFTPSSPTFLRKASLKKGGHLNEFGRTKSMTKSEEKQPTTASPSLQMLWEGWTVSADAWKPTRFRRTL